MTLENTRTVNLVCAVAGVAASRLASSANSTTAAVLRNTGMGILSRSALTNGRSGHATGTARVVRPPDDRVGSTCGASRPV
ncbi:hypothetical protein JCM33774_25050 [Actinophytocola sp. KF-1]